ncbi:MAG: ferritin-like domain-containing protein [Bauldia sp.]|nr:ferritin-like domain-containing protein [Bauldia sp.]
MEIRDFQTMYLTELQEARSLEALQIDALPVMADAADDRELADAFQAHLAETRAQFDQVEAILKRHRVAETMPATASAQAIVAEAQAIVDKVERGPLRDAALIAWAQRIEHLEIALYGTLATYAKMLGWHEEKRTLGGILEEERATDEDLSDIATMLVNPHAFEAAA